MFRPIAILYHTFSKSKIADLTPAFGTAADRNYNLVILPPATTGGLNVVLSNNTASIPIRINTVDSVFYGGDNYIPDLALNNVVVLTVVTGDPDDPYQQYTVNVRVPMAEGGILSFAKNLDNTVDEIHTFTYEDADTIPGYSSGDTTSTQSAFTFTTSSTIPSARILVVAGGGGAGRSWRGNGGGGGAGGLVYQTSIPIPSGATTVKVGKGGIAGASSGQSGENGADSKFDTIEAVGGGGGGYGGGSSSSGNNGGNGGSGGSGGGGGAAGSGSGDTAGNGGSGYSGSGYGGGSGASGSPIDGGGGGGAGGTGGNAPAGSNRGGARGAGRDFDISGTVYTYSTGGHGGGTQSQVPPVNERYGDGGDGPTHQDASGIAGHSGVVIVRFPYTR